MKIISYLAIFLLSILAISFTTQFTKEKEPEWPKKLEGKNGTITIYQPQTESFSGNKLEVRAAVSVTTKEQTAPVFGAIWLNCEVSTDKDNRTVELIDVKVSASKFPDIEEKNKEKIVKFIETEVPKWELVISLDNLLASLELTDEQMKLAENLNNEAPEIIYTTKPTVLISIDGEAKFKETSNKSYQYVVNTPYFIVQNTKKKDYYIKGGDHWYQSKNILEGWENVQKVPSDVEKLAKDAIPPEEIDETEKEKSKEEKKEEVEEDEIIPSIIVRTKAAELIQSNGEAEFASVKGTSLLYMKNTDADVLMNINTQQYYILIAGRWYTSKSLTDNKWQFIKPDEVPDDFAKIPAESEMSTVRASVSGTQESKDAILENQVPQTATVDRKDATVEVKYDGKPKFEIIEGTKMEYAVNTDKSVLLIDKVYYCVDNAIWFESKKPEGPWKVSTKVPDDVQSIPPENPNYNVKYVYIYDSTPEVVYVGYTPGYVYSYPYMGCVYYGTGYYYRPWYGAYYYPRPVTYGYGVHYNPYTGWGFSIRVGRPYGWMAVGFHPYHRAYWGPAGYRHGRAHGYRHGYHRGYHQGARAGYRAGYNAGNRNSARNNVYKNRSNGVKKTGGNNYNSRTGKNISNNQIKNNNRQKPKTSNKKNNVYADKKGNVYKKDNNSWQKRESGNWNKTKPSTGNVSNNQNRNKSNTQNMNRSYDNRTRGTQKSNNYNSNRQNYQHSSPSRSRPSSGGSRGGGGGGRRR